MPPAPRLDPGDLRDDGSERPRERRGREAGPVELDPFLRRPRGGDRSALLPPVLLEAGRAGGAALLRAHGGDDHRLSPLRLAPRLQDQPVLPVRARVLGPDQRAEGHPLVGRAPPEPPQVLGPARGRAQPAARLLVEPRGLDPLPALRGDRRYKGPLPLPRAALPEPVPPAASRAAGDRALPCG